ncbi:hypothetical protein FACS189426_15800 [Bacteroidia bacterium]|nr:hypothetical protein FACS189426_15800 [Bacteroidia bacterium]
MKQLYLAIISVCFLLPAQAQQTAKKDSASVNREMTLEKEYNPTIQDAAKLNQLPELREPQPPKSKVEFSNYAVPYEVQSGLTYLKPKAYLSDLDYSKYRGYLTAGVSTLVDVNADLGYQILNSGKDHLGIFASHRSSNSKLTNLQIDEKQKFKINDTWGGLNFQHDFETVKLNLDAKYTYSDFNYSGLSNNYLKILSSSTYPPPYDYGYEINTYPNQANNLFEAHAGISSDEANKTNYKVNATYTLFKQKYGATVDETGEKENRILFDWDFHKNFNSTMGSGFAGFFKNYSYSSIQDDSNITGNSNYSALSLNPYFYLEGDNLDLFVGGKVDVEFGGRKKVVGAPTIRFNYYPSDQFLFYLMADGGRKDNSRYNSFYENRYTHPWFRLWDSRTPLDGTAGIKFLPLRNFSVNIFGGYKITMDEHFFVPFWGLDTHTLYGTASDAYFADAHTIKAGGNIKYTFQDIFEIDLKGVYYKWDIKSDDESSSDYQQAWSKPNFVTDLNMAYRIASVPLKFNLMYHGEFGRKTSVPVINPLYSTISLPEIVDMKNIHDLSLKATYSINKYFSTYLSTNNLLFRKYDIWYGYPAQNFNIMAGINVLF